MSAEPRVLIVDDDASVRASLGAYLEDEGMFVESFAHARDVIAWLGENPADAAIVDVRLGEIDGQSLIVRAHQLCPDLKFLIYTGSLGYQLPDSLRSVGMTPQDVLYKPLRNLHVMAEAIRRIAGKERSDVQQR